MAFFGSTYRRDPEFLSSLLVIRNEKRLHLGQQRLANVVYSFQALVIVGMNGDTEEAIVGFRFSILGLLGLDDADNAHVHKAADMGRRIHQHHDVERITVVYQGSRDEAKIKRKHHAFRKHSSQLEQV